MTASKLRLPMASMGMRDRSVGALCEELGITRQTLYRHVAPDGALRAIAAILAANVVGHERKHAFIEERA